MNPFKDLSDEKLMEYYLKGESMAFDTLYLRHKDKIYGYLSRRIDGESDVSEVFQNVFMKFHKSRNLYSNKYPVLQWLYTITRSELLDFTKKKRILTIPLREEPISTNVERNIDIDNISDLTEKERKAVELRYFSAFDYEKISQRLETSQSNARKILSRAIGKIRKSLVGRGSQ